MPEQRQEPRAGQHAEQRGTQRGRQRLDGEEQRKRIRKRRHDRDGDEALDREPPAQLHYGERIEGQVQNEKQRSEGPVRGLRPDDRKPRDLTGEQPGCVQKLDRQGHQRRPDKNALHILYQGMLLGRGSGEDQHRVGAIFRGTAEGRRRSIGDTLMIHTAQVKRVGLDLAGVCPASAGTPPGGETCTEPPSPGTGCSPRPRSSPTMSLSQPSTPMPTAGTRPTPRPSRRTIWRPWRIPPPGSSSRPRASSSAMSSTRPACWTPT